MATRITLVLDDDIRSELESLVEPGQWDRVTNTALRKELRSIRRRRLSEELEHLRAGTRPVSTKDIVRLIHRDRSRVRR